MHHQTNQSKEPLSGELAVPGQTVDLGHAIYARYYDSPGVIPLGLGPGLARKIYSFTDHLPLQRSTQQRWTAQVVPSAVPSGPLWHRAFSFAKGTSQSLAAKQAVPGFRELRPETSLAPAGAKGTVDDVATRSLITDASASQSPDSARGKVVWRGSSARSVGATDEFAASSTPGARSSITKNKESASPAATTIDNSSKPVGSARVQRRDYREKITRAKSDGVSQSVPHESTIRSSGIIPAGKKPVTDIEISGSGLGTANPVQMGPPIFLRAVKGTPLQTKAQNASPPEIVNGRGVSVFANANRSAPFRHDASNPHGFASADSSFSTARPLLSNQIASGVPEPANTQERPANAQVHREAKTTGRYLQTALKSMNPEANNGLLSDAAKIPTDRNSEKSGVEPNGVTNLATDNAPSDPKRFQSISDRPFQTSPLLLRKNDANDGAKTRPLDSEVTRRTTLPAAPIEPIHTNLVALLARAANSAAAHVSSTKQSLEPAFRSDRGLAPELSGQQSVDKASTGSNLTQGNAIAVLSNQPEGSERIAVPERFPSAPIDGSMNSLSVRSTTPFVHRKEIASLASPNETTQGNPPSVSSLKNDAILPLDSRSDPAKTSGPDLANTDSQIKQPPDTVRTIASASSLSPPHSSLLHAKNSEARSLDSKLDLNDSRKASRVDWRIRPSTPTAAGSTPQPSIGPPLPLTSASTRVSRQSSSTTDPTHVGENLTPAGGRLSRSENDQPAVVLGAETEPLVALSERIHRGRPDHRVDSGLSTSVVRQPLVSSNAEVASAVLRKVVRHRNVTTAESLSTGSTRLIIPGDSAARYRTWARTDLALAQPKLNQATSNHEIPHSQGNVNHLQKSAANSTTVTGGQAASALPSLSVQSSSTPQSVTGVDLAQLTNRVYEMLVRRLASEKQRRGL